MHPEYDPRLKSPSPPGSVEPRCPLRWAPEGAPCSRGQGLADLDPNYQIRGQSDLALGGLDVPCGETSSTPRIVSPSHVNASVDLWLVKDRTLFVGRPYGGRHLDADRYGPTSSARSRRVVARVGPGQGTSGRRTPSAFTLFSVESIPPISRRIARRVEGRRLYRTPAFPSSPFHSCKPRAERVQKGGRICARGS